MLNKLLFILYFLFYLNIGYSNIIYDKNEITVTEIEFNEYLNIHENYYNLIPNKNKAIKDIVLIKRTINFLENNNKDFLIELDNNILKEFGNSIFEISIKRDFLRFVKIRNEFISDYFLNEFTSDDLKNAFFLLNELKLPISSNNCMLVDSVIDLKKNDYFIQNFYENISNKNKDYRVIIDNKVFNVCLNSIHLKKIENYIVQYIDKKIDKQFNQFVYSK
tara:strand:+ start:28 stop:687 length:660 start_codon:yes stop_codon:yes gene_type:complete